jgi:two-component system, NtrC family, response regulator AtoC
MQAARRALLADNLQSDTLVTSPGAIGRTTQNRFAFERNSPRCLVKPILLVLSVFRFAETRSLMSEVLEGAGHKLVNAPGCEQARTLLENGLQPDFVILESSRAAGSSDLFNTLKATSTSAVCLVHGPGEKQIREQASRLGVRLFLERPLTSSDISGLLEQLCAVEETGLEEKLENVETQQPIRATSGSTSKVLEELSDGRYFLASAGSMLKIYRQVQLLANVDAPVLILGESGTGKEVIAHLIHKHSRRSKHSFVNVNCAALPADLLESELFGYRQGAFTGAIKDKPGKFEHADHGTLLLDEIGEMSAQMQAKLLHVLQDGQFTRLGGHESSRVDVRVLAATNLPIESALVGKTFREDLYYRLNVFTINVPPLRERREEIPYLIEETIRRLPDAMRSGYDFNFPSRLMDAVLLYDWRGNVRELRNFVTRTMTMRDPDTAIKELEIKIGAGDRATQGEPPPSLRSENPGMRSVVRDMKDRAEAQMIKDALEVSGWNRRHAAKYLNISYRGLLYKIQQHRLAPKASSWGRSA